MDKKLVPQQLANAYVRIVDNCVFEEMSSILWPEFTQQGPGFGSDSREAFIANLEILRQYQQTFHMLGGQWGEWQGDTYTGETYCVASHLYERDGAMRKLDMAIRYSEVIELRDDVAKYLKRDLNVVWTEDRALEMPHE